MMLPTLVVDVGIMIYHVHIAARFDLIFVLAMMDFLFLGS